MHRAQTTAPHFKQLQKGKVWGGSGEAWSMALIAAMGYKSADEADVARAAGAMHTWTGLRYILAGAKLEAIWRVGVWRGAEADGGGDDGGAAMSAAVASWLKAQKTTAVPAGDAAKRSGTNRGEAGRGEANRAQAGGEAGAIEDGRWPLRGVPSQSHDAAVAAGRSVWRPAGLEPALLPATTLDRFATDLGHAAYLDAERRSDGSGFASGMFASLLARNEAGEVPGYPDSRRRCWRCALRG